jgi:tripartite ATP-independent transporter DctM subunit
LEVLPTETSAAPPAGPFARRLHRVEDAVTVIALAAMVLIPLVEIALRRATGFGIPGSIPFVQHLTLWVGLLGGAIAAREDRLLALATGTFLPEGRPRTIARVVAHVVASFVAAILAAGAFELVKVEREAGSVIAASVPVWVGQLILPIAFAVIAVRLAWRAGAGWLPRLLGFAAIALAIWMAQVPDWATQMPSWPGLAIILVAAALGSPIFALLGGAAAMLFLSEAISPAVVLVETYQLSVNPTLPTLPLFTLTGYLLAEGRASERILRVFRAFFGWLPGGTAIVCAAASAFFTAFTGGSGVTILALGGLLLPALLKDGYKEKFSLGLLTGSGSLGLLLPPSLPLILYGIVASIPIENLFVGGIVPGMLLVGLVSAWGFREGLKVGTGKGRFELREALASLWEARYELFLPVLILGAIFGGYATIVEASALAALYACLTQALAHRDFGGAKLFHTIRESAVTIGGVLVILGVAVGFSNYLIDANVPTRLLEWTQQYIHSPLVFLLGLNLFLLVVGCLMDIYSATFVVVPLIVPIGQAFGIDPVHLGIIFVANLELGYLTPPVGLNLFLSSYRFKKPLMEVVAASLPMLAILAVGLALITYVPWLTTGLVRLLGRTG